MAARRAREGEGGDREGVDPTHKERREENNCEEKEASGMNHKPCAPECLTTSLHLFICKTTSTISYPEIVPKHNLTTTRLEKMWERMSGYPFHLKSNRH